MWAALYSKEYLQLRMITSDCPISNCQTMAIAHVPMENTACKVNTDWENSGEKTADNSMELADSQYIKDKKDSYRVT